MFIATSLLFSCGEKKAAPEATPSEVLENKRIQTADLQSILDSAKVKGAIVIMDSRAKTLYSNDFDWAGIQRLPASTFKIPNSLIALETGVVQHDSTLFKWNGEERYLKVWEQDLTFNQAFHYSCVPCYQEVALKIGVKRMKYYLKEFRYGAMKVDSTNIDHFWLEGTSKISPLQQINFLQRFYESKLPISKRTEALMKSLMVIEKKEAYSLSGKTGWATANNTDNGWFVGYVEIGGNPYFFATNIEPLPDFDMKRFAAIRKEVTMAALQQIGILK
ncbi:class D beta-lactamase [Aggregatimonas sangjinii]|uniref:Beta-lactamase n=1 Tax=Aggregatimonas sangjinii TaxID=2583587 RepID=A0A5B7SUV5_9FLAO|nr:class D beta-lactamase [Aggregatimonas sangjinii]